MKRTGVICLLLSLVLAQQINAEFSTDKFNFGMAWDGNISYPSEVDYLTIWAGSDENWNDHWIGDMLRVCRSNEKTPVFYSYIIAFTARRDWGLADCDVSGSDNLCTDGARFIREEWSRITSQYEKYASNAARVYGTSKKIIWLMEPDYYQYNSSGQSGGGLSAQELAQKMSELVGIVKSHLPNAMISMDISPWTPDQRAWFSNFNMGEFSFMHTSGGRTDADSELIRNENHTTWKSIWDITGNGIIADDGYGVGGGSIGHDDTWDDPNNLNARIADGVIAITQADPRPDWGSIIADIRPQLDDPLTASGSQPTDDYSLSVSTTGQGSVSKSPDHSSYSSGSTVSLTASPADGYVFSGWSGDVTGTANPISVTMNSNKVITADFSAESTTPTEPGSELLVNGDFSSGETPWNLGVYGGSASGEVVNGEYKTSISQAGSAAWNIQFTQTGVNLEKGKTYTLTFRARAASARTVVANVGMSSSPYTSYMSSFEAELTTTMKTFTKTFTMEAGSDANARVEFNSGLSSVNWFLDDVSLVEGTESGTSPTEPTQYTLDMSVSGSGAVARSPQASSYDSGTSVSLTATPAQGYVFTGWGGDASGTDNPLSVTMNSNKTITASFAAQTVSCSLTVGVQGEGTVAKSPEAAEYESGSVVELTASPEDGYEFSGWSGDASGADNPLSFTMENNSTVTATFTQKSTTEPSAELVVNGDFSSGTDSWHLGAYSGAAANGSVKNGEYVISSSSAGSAAWNIQLTQTGVKLEKGKTYTVTFEARAASSRSMEVNVGMSSSPWVSYCGAFGADLTTKMQRFSKTFVMEQNSDMDARMEFNAGLANSTVYIDNVSIVEEAQVLGKRTTGIVNVVDRESTWSLRLAKDGLAVTSPAGGFARITLFDIRGRSMGTLFSGTLRAGRQLISCGTIPAGHYMLVMKDSGGRSVLRRRLVISD
ncbi:MAG: InlB B-repeat-containing protein [Chitinispirillaceae bacterium]